MKPGTVLRSKGGYLLPMAIIFILISLIMGMTILYMGGLERIAANRRLSRERAFYLAEAGAQWAFAHLKANPSWRQPQEDAVPVPLGDDTYNGTYLVYTEGTNAETIISVGRVGDDDRAQQETVELTVGGPQNSWSQGIFGSQSIKLEENAVVNGDIGSTGTITLDNNSTVEGDATVTGGSSTISMGHGADITGDENYNHTFDDPLQDLTSHPVVIPSSLSSLVYPVQGDVRISGSYTLSNGILTLGNNAIVEIAGGDFRFRQIVLGNGATLTMTGDTRFYVKEQWTLGNNSTIRWTAAVQDAVIYIGSGCTTTLANNSLIDNQTGSAGALRIYSASSNPLTFSNNTQTLSALVYAPSATVTFSNNAVFNGGIVADSVVLKQGAVVTYNVPDVPIDDDPGGIPPPRILRWRKPSWEKRLQ